MTTRLQREVSRLVPPRNEREKPLVVTMAPEGLYLRQFGQRRTSAFLLPYGYAYIRAAWLAADEKKRQKKERATARRKAK